MLEIKIFAKDENQNFTKIIREGIHKDFDITYKLLPNCIKEIFETWCNNAPTIEGLKITASIIYDDLEYTFIDHYWD